jgi:hypothetical protein
MWMRFCYSETRLKLSGRQNSPQRERGLKVRERQREREARTQLDNANGNMSHLTFSSLLRVLYDKKWRDSGADIRHQSTPTTLFLVPMPAHNRPKCSSPPPPVYLSRCLKNYRVICLFSQNLLLIKITCFQLQKKL